ncbi:MAG TPA: aminotransferase class III-fold pyridoxal phosphate-dependent enzyme, partial [Flavitalea sp.]|nr:aminotransferase class III-fold pyridoxal phosphate-dependent enzyme [Flavitalea sp.]
MDTRRMFLRHLAQTSSSPIAIHVQKAKGSRIRDMEGREYIDLIAGISVCNIGHRHPSVLRAMRKQMDEYLHVLVYGEMIETPQVEYATLLSEHLPPTLNSVYFTNSGAEAVEGAMKLAKRATGRTEIVAFNQSYHGSTQGALSIIGDEYWRNAYRPLLPGITHAEYNSSEAIDLIGENTACVIMETVQAERGVYPPSPDWIQALRQKCNRTGTLLVLDEIQTGFGRCGSLWAFEQYGIVPDILLLGKALGGGLPLGAFIAEKQLMRNLAFDPVLGHITTFCGHPLSCAAGLAAFRVLIKKDMPPRVAKKESLFRSLLNHPGIRAVRSSGLLIALELENATQVQQVVSFSLA